MAILETTANTLFQDLGLDQYSLGELLLDRDFYVTRKQFLSNPERWVDRTNATIRPQPHSPSGFELVEVINQLTNGCVPDFTISPFYLGNKMGHIPSFHLENGENPPSKNDLKALAKIEKEGKAHKILKTKLSIFFKAGGSIFLDHVQTPSCLMVHSNWRIQSVSPLRGVK